LTRDLKVLGLSVLFWGFGDGMIFYFQPLYLSELGADPSLIGGVLGGGALLMALTQIPAGYLSDRISRKTLLMAAWLLGLVSTVIMYLATSLTAFVLGFWLLFIAGFMFSPMARYISASGSPWALTRSLTTISALYGMGTIVGPLIGGQIANVFELRAIYLVAIFAVAISTIILIFLSPQPIVKPTKATGLSSFKNNIPLIRFLTLAFIAMLAMFLSWPLTPIYLQDIKLVSVGTIGILGSLNALGAVVLNLVVGRFKSHHGILLSIVFVGAGYFLAAGYRLCRVLVTGHIESYVDLEDSGLAYGIAETVGILVIVVASPTSGFLYEINPELPFPISLVMLTASLAMMLWWISRASPGQSVSSEIDPYSRKEMT
jgi:MFS family permease